MAWTQNSTTKVWTHAGTGRDVVVASTEQPARAAIVLECVDSAHEPVVVVYASGDGCTRYEAGIVGSNVVIRQIVFNGSPTTLTNGSTGDVPGAGACTAAHGLTSGVPFKLAVYVYDSTLEVLIDGVQKLVHRVLETEYSVVNVQVSGHVHFGFASSINGATLSAKSYDLVDAEPGPAIEVLFAVCDRNVWYSVDGVNMQPILGSGGGVGAFGDGLVELVESDGIVYGLGGGYAKKINTTTLQVTNWTATAGTFPGSSGLGTGQSRMRMLSSLVSRPILAGDKTDPQNLWAPAIGDPEDFDTAADTPGRAFALNTSFPGKVGQPITCISQLSGQSLLIGCVSQTWVMSGDPALALPNIELLSLSSGLSGPRSAALLNGGAAIAHSFDGVFLIAGGAMVSLSQGVISEGIQIPASERADYYITIARDPTRQITFLFVTPIDGSTGLHFAYSERTGGVSPGQGGFYPIVFGDDALQPVSACVYRGELILGTLDGRLVKMSDAVTTDDGEPFASLLSVAFPVIDAGMDTIVRRMAITPSLASASFTWTIYAGRTLEEAFDGSNRWLVRSGTCAAGAPLKPETHPVRAPALVLALSATGTRLQIEAVDVEISAGASHHRRIPTAPATPHAKCDIEADADGGDDFGDGDGEGDSFIIYLIDFQIATEAAAVDSMFADGSFVPTAGSGGSGGNEIDATATLGGSGSIIVVPH